MVVLFWALGVNLAEWASDLCVRDKGSSDRDIGVASLTRLHVDLTWSLRERCGEVRFIF